MRVLIVHDYGTLNGGAEIMARNLRDALRARGHECLLFTSSARPLRIPIVSDETCWGTVSPARRVIKAANPHAAVKLRALLRRYAPDVVHVKMFLTQLSPLILPPLRGVPSLLHAINYELVCPINTKTLPDGSPCRHRAGRVCAAAGCMSRAGVVRAWVQRRLTRLDVFDRVAANSRWVAGRLRDEGIRVDDIVYNGVPERPGRPPLSPEPLAAFAGRLVPKKGVDVLLRAMARVHRRLPAARLVIAGDGPERAALERLAAELGIAGSVTFLGHLSADDVEDALASAWVQAVPSRWEEPFGLVAAEAMMRGTAVVASGAGGLRELVAAGERGFTVPPGEVPELARALERVLGDRGLAERLGRAGRRYALENLTTAVHVDRMISIYHGLREAA